jgi:peptidoglycan/xylan/chitin deacetylase (PgdA/CDA1 family)
VNAVVVFYHYIREPVETPFAGVRALSPGDFATQLDWLAARADVVDGAAFERAVAARRPFARPSALLTFDDGFVDHYTNAFPAMRERGLAGVFFVLGSTLRGRPRLANVHMSHLLLGQLGPEALLAAVRNEVEAVVEAHASGPAARPGVYRYDERPEATVKRLLNYELPFEVADGVLDHLFRTHIGEPDAVARELYLTPAMIREMASSGMTFGFHTESHRVLSRLPATQQAEELAEGVSLIRELTGQDTVPFCYPYGFPHTYDEDTVRLLDAAGYSLAFNTVRRHARPELDPRFELPRFDTRDVPPWGSLLGSWELGS